MKYVITIALALSLVACASNKNLREVKYEMREQDDFQTEVSIDLRNDLDSHILQSDLAIEALHEKLDRAFKASLNK